MPADQAQLEIRGRLGRIPNYGSPYTTRAVHAGVCLPITRTQLCISRTLGAGGVSELWHVDEPVVVVAVEVLGTESFPLIDGSLIIIGVGARQLHMMLHSCLKFIQGLEAFGSAPGERGEKNKEACQANDLYYHASSSPHIIHILAYISSRSIRLRGVRASGMVYDGATPWRCIRRKAIYRKLGK